MEHNDQTIKEKELEYLRKEETRLLRFFSNNKLIRKKLDKIQFRIAELED